ncbi:hypothetical protein E2C01_031791 [Portunus trituberculatus]|uniref:Uncharacterized protein n=1 Tax=Portunus trituberculatus TaxID=210409 RepID=A0A5B7EXW4_PORTR|nr:hypothetical protein [Portunus trituberculatus]
MIEAIRPYLPSTRCLRLLISILCCRGSNLPRCLLAISSVVLMGRATLQHSANFAWELSTTPRVSGPGVLRGGERTVKSSEERRESGY